MKLHSCIIVVPSSFNFPFVLSSSFFLHSFFLIYTFFIPSFFFILSSFLLSYLYFLHSFFLLYTFFIRPFFVLSSFVLSSLHFLHFPQTKPWEWWSLTTPPPPPHPHRRQPNLWSWHVTLQLFQSLPPYHHQHSHHSNPYTAVTPPLHSDYRSTVSPIPCLFIQCFCP